MRNIGYMKRIGILGGSSDQATVLYYRRLNALVKERLGGFNTAEMVLVSMNFALSEYCVRNGGWAEIESYLEGRVRALEAAGADFYLCVSNTLHRAAPKFTAVTKLPFLHIADPTGAAVTQLGLSRVALLGTYSVMSSVYMRDYFEAVYGLVILVPSFEEMQIVDRILFDELDLGIVKQSSKGALLAIIDRLANRGAQGVILGCTEFPMIINQADRPSLPFFDTMALHVQQAVEIALGTAVCR